MVDLRYVQYSLEFCQSLSSISKKYNMIFNTGVSWCQLNQSGAINQGDTDIERGKLTCDLCAYMYLSLFLFVWKPISESKNDSIKLQIIFSTLVGIFDILQLFSSFHFPLESYYLVLLMFKIFFKFF